MLAMLKALGLISMKQKNGSQQEENCLPCKPDSMSYILWNLQCK